MEEKVEIMEEVVIVGAGIAGLATALALKRVGIEALVLERSEALRTTGAALTLFTNAWIALDALGISRNLTSLYHPLVKGSVTDVATGSTQQMSLLAGINSNRDSASFGPRAVHRKNLLEALAHEIPADRIRFSSKITAIETQELGDVSVSVVHLKDGPNIKAKVLIGCDGVHSVVANWIGLKEPAHSGRSAVRGIAVYPEGHGLNQEVQQFVCPGKRGGFGPLNDKEIYWFLAFKGENAPADPKLIQKEMIENQAKNFPPIFLDVVQHADLSSLSCAPLLLRYPWHIIFGNFRRGNVTVAGDAMHPMTPDLGQGGCSALEDAVVLGRHLGNCFLKNGRLVSKDVCMAIDEYIKERRWRVAGLVTGSYLSGWIQQDGSKWWMKFLRDKIFYPSFGRVAAIMQFDCGRLPVASHCQGEDPTKRD